MTASQHHKWGDPNRMVYKTERVCVRCGLIKVSRHEPTSHWVEWWRPVGDDGVVRIRSERTPACVAVAVEEARAAA